MEQILVGRTIHYSVLDDGVSVDQETGVVTIDTQKARPFQEVRVTVNNSGGEVDASFFVEINSPDQQPEKPSLFDRVLGVLIPWRGKP